MILALKKLWLKLRVGWSNIRWGKNNPTISQQVKVNNASQIQLLAKDIYNKFTYEYDDITELFDAMRTPSRCYQDYLDGELKDDCDGFHAALYCVVQESGYECYLMTYITTPITDSHTVLLVKIKNQWHIFNYKSHLVLSSLSNIKEEIEDKYKVKIDCYNFTQFKNGKYEIKEL